MKVYRWEETDSAYVAILRPDELFDLSTKIETNREKHEAEILAHHRIYGEMLVYARIFYKGCILELIKSMLAKAPDIYLNRDMEALSLLNHKQRKTA